MNILILRRFNFSGDYRSFITRQSIRLVLARCLFKKILLILLIFFICKNRENMRNLITLKQESSQFKINLKCANNDTDFNFFLRNIPELLGYRVRTQAFGTCTSYHYNSYINISFSCGFLHGGICFLFLITFIEIWRYLYFTSCLVSYICRNSDALTRSHFAKPNTLVKVSFSIAHYPAEQF